MFLFPAHTFSYIFSKSQPHCSYKEKVLIKKSIPCISVTEDALRADIRNFHLGPCKIEKSNIAKLCHNKGLPKPFIKI